MSWSLPKLPGYHFGDPTRTHFHVPQQFTYCNGYAMPPMGGIVNIGGQQNKVDGSAYLSVADECSFDPALTYGRVKDLDLPVQLPHWVHYDKKKLCFRGFLRQSVSESPLEIFRIRPIVLTYYLEDDTLAVAEPEISNSGLWHGKLVKRGKHTKGSGQCWHWKDLNNGIDIPLFGKVFHLTECDDFTREFLESQGIEVVDGEVMPFDPHTVNQMLKKKPLARKGENKAETLRKFLEYDGKVLKFEAIWDDTANEYGETRPCEIYYFLVDDTMSVKECHSRNDGRDPVSVLLKRMRVPQNWKERVVDVPVVSHEAVNTEENEEDFFHPRDLIVGKSIQIMGRPFIITDCDPFTRNFFKCVLNIDQPASVTTPNVKEHCEPKKINYETENTADFPPRIQSFLDEPTPKDLIRMGINATRKFRYTCEMIPAIRENNDRKFILSYSLSNGALRLDEIASRNSGFPAKCFVKMPRAKVPGTTDRYYTPDMFYIGAIIVINNFKFRITGCDLFVYRYMQEYPYKFSKEVIDNVRNYHFKQGNLKEDLQEATQALLSEGVPPPERDFDSLAPVYDSYETCMRHQSDPKRVSDAVQGIPCSKPEQPSVVCFTGPAIPRRDDDEVGSVKSDRSCCAQLQRTETPAVIKRSVQFADCE